MIEFDGINLKEGCYELNLEEIEKYFVKNMPNTKHREIVYKSFKNYCEDLDKATNRYFQFIDGSFTTKKKEPNDIDVVSFIDVDDLLFKIKPISNIKDKYDKISTIDGYFAPLCDIDNPYRQHFKEKLIYWLKWFGHTKNGKPKGIVIKLYNCKKGDIC